MKKMTVSIILLFLTIFSACSKPAPVVPKPKHLSITDNQLQNPGFEKINSTYKPYFWDVSNGKTSWANEYISPYAGHYYLYHLKEKALNGHTLSQSFNLQDRGFDLNSVDQGLYSVDFGGYHKSFVEDKTLQASIELLFFDANAKPILTKVLELKDPTTEWQKKERLVELPKGTRTIKYAIRVSRSANVSFGPLLDDMFVFIKKNEKIAEPKTVLEPLTSGWATNNELTRLVYTDKNTIVFRDLISNKDIFKKEYKEAPHAYFRDNSLVIFTGYNYKEVIDMDGKNQIVSKDKSFDLWSSEVYKIDSNNKTNVYDIEKKKLRYSFSNGDRYFIVQDKKSNKLIRGTYLEYDTKGNIFSNRYIHIYDILKHKGNKVCLLPTGKKNVLPIATFKATDKNGEAVFFQISAYGKLVDEAVKLGDSAFNTQRKHQDFLKKIKKALPTDFHVVVKGIRLSDLKEENWKDKQYMVSDVHYNRFFSAGDVSKFISQQLNTKLSFYVKRIADNYIADSRGNSITIDDAFTAQEVEKIPNPYPSKKSFVTSSILQSEDYINGNRVITLRQFNADQKVLENPFFQTKLDPKTEYFFFETPDHKHCYIVKMKKDGKAMKSYAKVIHVNLISAETNELKLPLQMKEMQYAKALDIKLSNENIFITNGKQYMVLPIK
ncbi:hypothetical protein [Sulfurimonas sp.]|uniref:hypothetical protein n=1 Tax=Sulfurimonas sp. TaxID=2022749 RepID=UPI003D13FBE3